MKRLTERLENGVIHANFMKAKESVMSRLADIEVILGDEYELDRLRETMEAEKEDRYIIMKEPRRAGVHRLTELVEADREGRCVVLPCKVGDNAYTVCSCMPSGPFVEEWTVTMITMKRDGNIKIRITESGSSCECTVDKLGKTVFLTRTEAEAALKAREQE